MEFGRDVMLALEFGASHSRLDDARFNSVLDAVQCIFLKSHEQDGIV